MQLYTLTKLICMSDKSESLRNLIDKKISGKHTNFKLDLTEQIKDNFVLNSYGLSHETFIEAIEQVIDFRNRGYAEMIPSNINLLLKNEEKKILSLDQTDNLFALK